MSAPDLRRGACPTLLDPMATGDGLLARLVPARGAFSPAELAGLARAAEQRGNGVVEVTARGSFQIRGLTPASSAALAADAAALGIEPRAGVPVETGPLAGLDPSEIDDGSRLARSIAEGAARAGLGDRLGPKVSVVVDGGGAVPLAASLADVRLDAAGHGQWRLGLAGTRAMASPLAVISADEAEGRVFALLGIVASLGRAARGRDLLAGDAPRPPRGSPPEASPLPVGAIPLRGGAAACRLVLPFGQVSASALGTLAEEAGLLGLRDIRLSPGHAVLLIGEAALAEPVRALGRRLGFVADADDPRLRVSACAGAPACASAHLDTKRLVGALAALMAPGSATVHLSGCAKRCAEPKAAVRAVGTDAGRVSLDGAELSGADAVPAILDALRTHPASRRGRAA
ncbi:precorrin-3B synthase [Antarcticirhabdus aurantiaca]|uniref:Precorrin-3B synthase n=1 Tax=Antarcticirhabdus aurantiaca TaxID=2606717 RepID=A0ACD4NHL5_9HYPH|nr:precorrin-3B synthase [Antarcticirhabdus aurantiaca]WAJ26332.1 precorrin-3B synthase [Jeongeuplla avenae]